MRKIDKSHILSTAYKKWIDSITQQGIEHPKYYSNHRFYNDIVMNLFYCQKGLCAYTEQLLCKQDFYHIQHWNETGNYTKKYKKKGQLDHFSPELKEKKGWLWENFFMVESDINIQKRDKAVYDLLKPDREGYSPEKYLPYSATTGRYVAKASLSAAEQKQVEDMIEIIGINHPTVVERRKEIIFWVLKKGIITQEFPTAIEMATLNPIL